MSATTSTRSDPGPAARAFGTGFRFGVATAAFQVEGAAREDGRGESIWDRFCAVPGAVAGGDTGDVACDHYHRWSEDLDVMQELGIEAYRFSVSWPRVLPTGAGAVNQAGLDFYDRLVDGLLERGIEPLVTLYHWDLPQALQDAGGWQSRDTAARMAEYAAVVAEALGDRVGHWITHNEPWVTAFLGHAHGGKAPGIRDWPAAIRVSHHLLLSHGSTLAALRAALPAGGRCGIALNVAPVRPASESPVDAAAARRLDGHLNRWFLDPLFSGSYPADVVALYEEQFGALDLGTPEDMASISAPLDFLGVNYYNPQTVADAPESRSPLRLHTLAGDGPHTAMGWEVDPDGLLELLTRIRRDYGDRPIFITENGAAFEDAPGPDGAIDDHERVSFLAGHLEAVARSMEAGIDVRRYFVWSLLDNFEWEHGYDKRFGIVHVDYETLRRTPKRSAHWYRDFIAGAREGQA